MLKTRYSTYAEHPPKISKREREMKLVNLWFFFNFVKSSAAGLPDWVAQKTSINYHPKETRQTSLQQHRSQCSSVVSFQTGILPCDIKLTLQTPWDYLMTLFVGEWSIRMFLVLLPFSSQHQTYPLRRSLEESSTLYIIHALFSESGDIVWSHALEATSAKWKERE